MPQKDGHDPLSFDEMLKFINRKWTILTIMSIARSGRVRFNDLKRSLIGISPKTLIETLRDLETLGVVTADKLVTTGHRMEYHLTDDGKTFQSAIMPLVEWIAGKDGSSGTKIP